MPSTSRCMDVQGTGTRGNIWEWRRACESDTGNGYRVRLLSLFWRSSVTKKQRKGENLQPAESNHRLLKPVTGTGKFIRFLQGRSGRFPWMGSPGQLCWVSLVSTGWQILATMDTPCRRVDPRHHLMVWCLPVVSNVLQCVNVSCVHIKEHICAEITCCGSLLRHSWKAA